MTTESKLDSDDICLIIRAVREFERSVNEAKIKTLSINPDFADEFIDADEEKSIEMIKNSKEMSEFVSPLKSVRNCVRPIKNALSYVMRSGGKQTDNVVTIYRYNRGCITNSSYDICPNQSFGFDRDAVRQCGEDLMIKDIARRYGS